MSEADRNGRTRSQTPATDTSETTDEENAQEIRQKTALQELFLILEENARIKNKPVNSAIHAIPIPIKTGNDISSFTLRINPAIVSNGKLEVAVLDFYRGETYHLQQWVIKAKWTDEGPKITGLDASRVGNDTRHFRLTEIVEYAGSSLRKRMDEADGTNTTPNLAMSTPPGYSNRIN